MPKSSLNITKQVKIDLADEKISDAEKKSFLRILGSRLSNNSNETLKASEKKKFIFDIINVLKTSKNSEVQESAFWSLTQATAVEFDDKMIAEFVTYLDVSCQDSKSVGKCYEACNFLQRIIKENKGSLKKHVKVIAGCLLKMVVHPVTKIRESSYPSLEDFLPTMLHSQSQVAPHLSKMVVNGSFVKDCLHLSKNSNQGVYVLTVMDHILVLLKEELWSGQSVLKLFVPIIERGFKARNCEELKAAFVVWKTLIEVISQDLDILTDPKRLKFILQPVRVRLLKYPTVLPAFQDVYWTLIVKLKDRLPSNFEKLVIPLLETILCCSLEEIGNVLSPPLRSKQEKNLPMVQIAGQMLLRIFELPPNPSCTELIYCKEKLVLTVPELVVSVPIFVLLHNFKKLVKALKHIMFALGKNEENAMLLETLFISLLRASSYSPDKANKFSVDAVSLLLSLADQVINDEVIPPNSCLKFLESFTKLPSFILATHYCHLGHNTVMHNNLAMSLVTLLLKPYVFSASRKESSFRSIFQCLVSVNILETSSALIYAKMFIDIINDKKFTTLAKTEDLLLMWCNIAVPLLEVIKKTREVNQGDSLENDFSCLYNILLYPVLHFLPLNASEKSFNSPLKYWTDLYKLLIEYAPFTSSIETNAVCEEFCQKLNVSIKQDLLQNELYFEVLCSMLKVIIDNLDFESVNLTQGSLDSENSQCDQSKKKPLGNMTAITNLSIFLMQALYEKLSVHEKQCTEFQKEGMFETAELSKYSMFFDLIGNFCSNIKKCSLIPPLMSSIAKPLSKLFLMSHGDKSDDSQLSSKMNDLWESISTNILHHYSGPYDETFLKILSPIFESTYDHACSGVVNASKALWITFEHNQSSSKWTKNMKNSVCMWAEKFSGAGNEMIIGNHGNLVGKDMSVSSKETLGAQYGIASPISESDDKSNPESKEKSGLDDPELSEKHSKDSPPKAMSSNVPCKSLEQNNSLCSLDNQISEDSLFVKPEKSIMKIVRGENNTKSDTIKPSVPEVVDIISPDANESVSFCFDVSSIAHNENNPLLPIPTDGMSLIDTHEHNYSQTSILKNQKRTRTYAFRRGKSKQANSEKDSDLMKNAKNVSLLNIKELSTQDGKASALLAIEYNYASNPKELGEKESVCLDSDTALSNSSDHQQISSIAKSLENSTDTQNGNEDNISETVDPYEIKISDNSPKRTSVKKLNESHIKLQENEIHLSEPSSSISTCEIDDESILAPVIKDNELKYVKSDEIDNKSVRKVPTVSLPVFKKNEVVGQDTKTSITSELSAVDDDIHVNATDNTGLDSDSKYDPSVKSEINTNIGKNNSEGPVNQCDSIDSLKDVNGENSDCMAYEHNYSQTPVLKKRKRKCLSRRKGKTQLKSQHTLISGDDNKEMYSQNSESRPEAPMAASEVKLSSFSIICNISKITNNDPLTEAEADNNEVDPSEKNVSSHQEKSLDSLNETKNDEMDYSSQEIFSDPPSESILKSDIQDGSNIIKSNLCIDEKKKKAKKNSQLNTSDPQMNTRSLRSPRKRGSPLWLQNTIRPSLVTKKRKLNTSSVGVSSDEGSPSFGKRSTTNESPLQGELNVTLSTETEDEQNRTPTKIKQDKVKEKMVVANEKLDSEQDGLSLEAFVVNNELSLKLQRAPSAETEKSPKHSKTITDFKGKQETPDVEILNSDKMVNFDQDKQKLKTLHEGHPLSEELKKLNPAVESSSSEAAVPKKRKRRSVYVHRRSKKQQSTTKSKNESESNSQSSQDSLPTTEFPVSIQDEQSVSHLTMDVVEILMHNDSSKIAEVMSSVNPKHASKDNCDYESTGKSLETLPEAMAVKICKSNEDMVPPSQSISANVISVYTPEEKFELEENEKEKKPVEAEVNKICESSKSILPSSQLKHMDSTSAYILKEEKEVQSAKNKNMKKSHEISHEDVSDKICESSEDILPPSESSHSKSRNIVRSKYELADRTDDKEKTLMDVSPKDKVKMTDIFNEDLSVPQFSSDSTSKETENKSEDQTVKAVCMDDDGTAVEASMNDCLPKLVVPTISSRMMQTRSRTGINKVMLHSETLKEKPQRKKKISTLSNNTATSSSEIILNMDPQISSSCDNTNGDSAANVDLNKANSILTDCTVIKPTDDLVLSQKEALDDKLHQIKADQNSSESPNSLDLHNTLINSESLDGQLQKFENTLMSLEAEASSTGTILAKKPKRKGVFAHRKNKNQQKTSNLIDSEISQDLKNNDVVPTLVRHYKQSILPFVAITEKSQANSDSPTQLGEKSSQFCEASTSDCELRESDNLLKVVSDSDISRIVKLSEIKSYSQPSSHSSENKAFEKPGDEVEDASTVDVIKVDSISLVNKTSQFEILSTLPSRTMRTRGYAKAEEENKSRDKLNLKVLASRRKSNKKTKDNDISIVEKPSLDVCSESALNCSTFPFVTADKEIYDNESEPNDMLGDIDSEKADAIMEKDMLQHETNHLGIDQITVDIVISNSIKIDGANLNNVGSTVKDSLKSPVSEHNVSLDNELSDSQITLSKADGEKNILIQKQIKDQEMNLNTTDESRSSHVSSVRTRCHKQSTLPFIAISEETSVKDDSVVLMLDKNVDEASRSIDSPLTLNKNLGEISISSDSPSTLDKNLRETVVSNDYFSILDENLGDETSVNNNPALKLDKDSKGISVKSNPALELNQISGTESISNNSASMLNKETAESFKNPANSMKLEPVPCEMTLEVIQDANENISNSSDDILPSSQFSANDTLKIYTNKAELVKQLDSQKEKIDGDLLPKNTDNIFSNNKSHVQQKLISATSSRTVKTCSYSAAKAENEEQSKPDIENLTSEAKPRKNKVIFSIASEDAVLNIENPLLDLCSGAMQTCPELNFSHQVNNGDQGMEGAFYDTHSVNNADLETAEHLSNKNQDSDSTLNAADDKNSDTFEVDHSQGSISQTLVFEDRIPESQEFDNSIGLEPEPSSAQLIVSKKRKKREAFNHKKSKNQPKQKVLKTEIKLNLDTVHDLVLSSSAESPMQVEHEPLLCSAPMVEKTAEVDIPINVTKIDNSDNVLFSNCTENNEENESFICEKLNVTLESNMTGICDTDVKILSDTQISSTSENERAERIDNTSSNQFTSYPAGKNNHLLQLTTPLTNASINVPPASPSKTIQMHVDSDRENVEQNVPNVQLSISEDDKSSPGKVDNAVISNDIMGNNDVISSDKVIGNDVIPIDKVISNDVIPSNITEISHVMSSDITTIDDISTDAKAICKTEEVASDLDSKTLSTYHEFQVNSAKADNCTKPSTMSVDLQQMEVTESAINSIVTKKRKSPKKTLHDSKFIRNTVGRKIPTSVVEGHNLYTSTTNSECCDEVSKDFEASSARIEAKNKQNIVFTCSSHLKVALNSEEDPKNKVPKKNRIALTTLESILPLHQSAMSFIASAREESVNIHSYEMKISANATDIPKHDYNDSSESSHCEKSPKVLPNKNAEKCCCEGIVPGARPVSSNALNTNLLPCNVSRSPTSRGIIKNQNKKTSPFLSLNRSPTSRSEAMLQASQSKRLRQEESAKKQKTLSPGMVLNEMQSTPPSTPKSSRSQFRIIRNSDAFGNESVSEENNSPMLVKSILKKPKQHQSKHFLQKKISKKVHFTEPSPEEKYKSPNQGMTFSERVKSAKAKRLNRKAAKIAKTTTQKESTNQSPSPKPQSEGKVPELKKAKSSRKVQLDQEVPEFHIAESFSKTQSIQKVFEFQNAERSPKKQSAEKVPEVHNVASSPKKQYTEKVSDITLGTSLEKLGSPTVPTLNVNEPQGSCVIVSLPILPQNNQVEAKELAADSAVSSEVCEAGPSSASRVQQFNFSSANLDDMELNQIQDFIDRVWHYSSLQNVPIFKILRWQEELQKLLRAALEKQFSHHGK